MQHASLRMASCYSGLDGVVGYHVRLTRERSSVRTRVETKFFGFLIDFSF